MSDKPPGRPADKEQRRGFLRKVADLIHPAAAESTTDLLTLFAAAETNGVIGAESRVMLEGVLRLSTRSVDDVMVPAARMDVLDIDAPQADLLRVVINTAHSRFPVFSGKRENIIGTLHAKDMLKLLRAPELNLRTLLRPATFVPEGKGLVDLLHEFRHNHNHMAMVIDEFGSVCGLITIEDVLEQIVGEIEDEFDEEDAEGDIFGLADNSWRISGDTPIDRVAGALEVDLQVTPQEDGEFDTIGGLIAHRMGHVPRRDEEYALGDLCFRVLHTRGGAVRWFKLSRTGS